MAMTPGLSPSIRQTDETPASPHTEDPGIVIDIDEGEDKPDLDGKGSVIQIEHPDGSVTISLDGKPLETANDNRNRGWFDNLVDDIDQMELGRIADDLLRGIDEDISNRKDWEEERAQGLRLLGLKIEIPNTGGAQEGAPVDGMSKVRHPLLLEATLRFQANARSELLPTDGPVKVRDDNTTSNETENLLAEALEKDMNHYLTAVASEYYPDTDRMLLLLGFGGSAFKKVYKCPVRDRPVSESVDADDLIVNNDAIDLKNALRVTHRINMRTSMVRRMQLLGVYRDIPLDTPRPTNLGPVRQQEKDMEGVRSESSRPEDREREIYECYCELDIDGFAYRYKGKVTGLEVPYRVTIDVSTREILAIVRNYNRTEGNMLPKARTTFVKFPFVPGVGFYDLGLLHILGNTTNALTAAWRLALDNAMFANFPGFLVAKSATRQNTTLVRVPAGGGAQIDTGGMKIGEAVMPLPYKTEGMAALMTLVENMAETGMRVGGTSEQQVGEGRADAPVGTTLAMIEQATKILNAVHKRLHSAQAEEFQLLKECFRENPESFLAMKCKSGTQWNEALLMKALDSCNLVPQADPNTASHTQRIMRVVALKQLQSASPSLYDPIAVDRAALTAIGWANPEQFFTPPGAQASPPPEMLEAQAKAKAEQEKADAAMTNAQAKAKEVDAKIQQGAFAPKQEAGLGAGQPQTSPLDAIKAQTAMLDAKTKSRAVDIKHADMMAEDQNRDLDRQSREKGEMISLVKELITHPDGVGEAEAEAKKVDKDTSKK